MNTNSYDHWLDGQRSGLNRKIWLVKGGDVDYNYSSYQFKSDGGETREIVIGSGLNSAPIKVLPRAIPTNLTVDIYTQNQLLKSSTVLEGRSFLLKQIPSDFTVEDVKSLVIKEIVAGIAMTFQLDPTKMLQSDKGDAVIDFNRIEFIFYYFNPVLSSWRAISGEVDWLHAKQQCMDYHEKHKSKKRILVSSINIFICNIILLFINYSFFQQKTQQLHEPHDHQIQQVEEGRISLMYSLEKKSEEYILKIVKYYQERKKKLLEDGREHISLALLTDALANMTASFKLKGKSHNSSPSPPRPARSKGAAEVQPRKSPAVIQKSILYPKPAEYLKIKKQNELLTAKQEILAQKFEEQLLKTRW